MIKNSSVIVAYVRLSGSMMMAFSMWTLKDFRTASAIHSEDTVRATSGSEPINSNDSPAKTVSWDDFAVTMAPIIVLVTLEQLNVLDLFVSEVQPKRRVTGWSAILKLSRNGLVGSVEDGSRRVIPTRN